jgi:hypothetical protein
MSKNQLNHNVEALKMHARRISVTLEEEESSLRILDKKIKQRIQRHENTDSLSDKRMQHLQNITQWKTTLKHVNNLISHVNGMQSSVQIQAIVQNISAELGKLKGPTSLQGMNQTLLQLENKLTESVVEDDEEVISDEKLNQLYMQLKTPISNNNNNNNNNNNK